MKTTTLSRFDNITAAGILARAALSLEDNDNPAAVTRLPDEDSIRKQLLDEISQALGIALPFSSISDREKLGDELDNQSEQLLSPVDEDKVLDALSAKGELPTDLYDVTIDEGMLDVYDKRKKEEERLIQLVVRYPDTVQHFSPNENEPTPLISLFSKYIKSKYAQKSFTLLVTGIRNGTFMLVSQAWRIYDDSPAVATPYESLVELLNRFADECGVTIRYGDLRGKFILQVIAASGKSLQNTIQINLEDDNKDLLRTKDNSFSYMIAHFDKRGQDNTLHASLVYSINLARYKKILSAHGWESERIGDFQYPIGTWNKSERRKDESGPDSD